jgi:tetratricopeptide (TPR) repeat protein
MARLAALLWLLASISTHAPAQEAVDFYKQGLVLKTEKKYREAIESFTKAASLKTAYGEALFELGWCYNEIQDYGMAIDHLIKALEAWPGVPKVYFELGYAYEKSNKTDSAIALYNRCLVYKPDYLNAYKQLAFIAFNQKNYALALAHYNKAISRIAGDIKDYLFWYRKGYCENSIEDYTNAKISLLNSLSYKKDELNTLLELGFACKQLKNNEAAIDYYKQAIELNPQSHIGYNGIGDVFRDNVKNMQEATVWYKKTLDINPKERKGNFGIGYCLNSTGQYEAAIPYLKTAIESEPNYTAAFVELGYSHYKTDKYTEAITYLSTAAGLNSKNINARYYLGLVYLKQKNKEKAQQMADELKNLGSKFSEELQKKVNEL